MSHLVLQRRQLLQSVAATTFLTLGAGKLMAAPAPVASTPLHWMDGEVPDHAEGATLGVPWPRGTLKPVGGKLPELSANATPLQSWPLAYWPDGSLKWTGHAVPAGVTEASLSLKTGKPAAPQAPVSVATLNDRIEVSSGDLQWVIPLAGEALIASASRQGRPILSNMKLVALWQDQPDLDAAGSIRQAKFTSKITSVTVEQTGPVRAVLKTEGVHAADGREWLPFSVRLYFYAGAESVRLVHSFIYDGTPANDFIRGLGVTAQVPMRDESYNRHIRLSGEGEGVWGEAVRPITGLRRNAGEKPKADQVAGRFVDHAEISKSVQDGLKWIPEWGDVTLAQLSPDGFTITKRTRAGHAWIDVNAGTRTKGLAYVGGVSGGVALGFKDFWQRPPVSLDVRNAHTDTAEITAWLWSPDARAMDVRPYRSPDGMDTHPEEIEGLNITYEDYEAGWDTPVGVARTSELTLWALAATPSYERFSAMAEQVANPARLALPPARIHQCNVFGDWSLPDRSTPARVIIEDHLTYLIDYYINEVEQRRWYGFWSYGDVMHSYDRDRHVWSYDIGGYAWANSELSPDLWIWYTYLRTGRADVFKFAEAMTRHTGEVDVYHLGRFKGLGTRHGIQHWSDSSKQVRVSTAAYRRIYYYLTADERVGDLMRDLVDSEFNPVGQDVGRKLGGTKTELPDGIIMNGVGNSWGAYLAAWLTEWERTQDKKWRDRLVNGMTTAAKMKYRFFTSGSPYDLKTGKFIGDSERVGVSHLSAVFGLVETHAELWDLVDVPAYKAAWLEYCRYFNGTREENLALLGQPMRPRNLRDAHSRLSAFAAHHEKDKALALRAWSEFLIADNLKGETGLHRQTKRIDGPHVLRPLDEESAVSTNWASQWGLSAIQNLALIGDSLDEAAHLAGWV